MLYTVEELKASPDFFFRHMLHDTVILLGGKKEIAALLDETQDRAVTYEDLNRVMNYNIELMTEAKTMLTGVHSSKINVEPPEK